MQNSENQQKKNLADQPTKLASQFEVLVDSQWGSVHKRCCTCKICKVWEKYGFFHSSELLWSNSQKLQSLRPVQFFGLLQTEFKRDLQDCITIDALGREKTSFLYKFFPHAREMFLLGSATTQLVTAVLQLLCSGHHFRVETDRWERIPREQRICRSCDVTEDEMHALFEGPCYQHRGSVTEEQLLNNQADKIWESIMVQAIYNRPSESLSNQKILNYVAIATMYVWL